MSCELCDQAGGPLLWQGDRARVVLVDDADYPGFCRVIWQAHVKEMTDLPEADQLHLMRLVFAVEAVLRTVLQPEKINLASLGNMTPHLHWHVIPRHASDPDPKNAVWGIPAESLKGSMSDDEKRSLVERLRGALLEATPHDARPPHR